ncbi:MAG: dTMP kinase [bacterium]
MARGRFITLEGIEGSGKSTQAALLRDFLAGRGYDVVVTREPGGSPIAEKIREILLDPRNLKMVPLAELFLYEASRTQHVAEVIRPALEAGRWVLCDRFFDASTAYQGNARGLGIEMVAELNLVATSGLVPDLTLVLDLPVEVGLKRLGRSPDRIESETLDFHERVRQGYLEIARCDPSRIKVVDASGTIDDIHVRIRGTVESWLSSLR